MIKNNNVLTAKIIAFFVMAGILTQPLTASAIVIPFTPPNQRAGDLPPDQINPANFFKPPTPPGGSISQDIMSKWRAEDRKRCELEATGKKNPTIGQAVAGAVTKPLENAINEKIGMEALPPSIDYTNPEILESTSRAIEEELQKEIQEGIKDGLREELPKTLAQKLAVDLAEARARGVTEEVWRSQGQFEGLIEASIRESWPKVLNKDFIDRSVIRATDRGLRSSLKNNLRLNFNQTAKTTIEEYYGAQIDEMLGTEIPQLVKEHIESMQATIEGTRAGLEAVLQGFKDCITDPICLLTRGFTAVITFDSSDTEGISSAIAQLFPEVKQVEILIKNLIEQIAGIAEFLDWLAGLDKDQLVKDMLNGLTAQLTAQLTQPKNIERLADAVGNAISDPINRSLEQSIDKVMDAFTDPVKAVVDAVNMADDDFLEPIVKAFDLQLNTAIAQITVPATAMIDRLGTEMATAIDNTVGRALYPFAAGIHETATGLGNFVGDGITKVGFGLQDLVFKPPPLIIIDRDLNIEESLAPNVLYRDDYEAMRNFGWAVVHDDVGRPTAPGEIRYSDYLAEISTDDTTLAGALPPTWSAVDGIAGDAAEGVQNAGEQVAQGAINNQLPMGPDGQPGFASNIANNLGTALGQTFSASVGALFEGVPYVGPILSQIVEQILNEAIFGTTAANAAAGLPVMDIGARGTAIGILMVSQGTARTAGKILSTEEQTKQLTEKILNLQIQACTNLKVVRRIQLLAEEKMFVWDPNARKAAARALNEHKDRLVQFFNQGYEVSAVSIGRDVPGGTGENKPLYIQNLDEHLAEVTAEQTRIFLYQLNNSAAANTDFPHLQSIHNKLYTEQNETFADQIKPTITKAEYDQITGQTNNNNAGLANSTSGDRKNVRNLAGVGAAGNESSGAGNNGSTNNFSWELWRKIIQPQNNPPGAEQLIRAELARRQAMAEYKAREELAWGQGILPPRECADEDRLENGDCVNWKVKTPAAVIREYMTTILTSLIRQLEQSDKAGEDFLKKELDTQLQQLQGLKQDSYTETLDGSIFKGQDPCPGPGQCPDSGF